MRRRLTKSGFITKRWGRARLFCSYMSSPAIIAAGSRSCVPSANAIAASPMPRAATNRPTCRQIPPPTATGKSCDDAVAVLDHLRIARAHLVGLSMGGYTVLQVALNHPVRVRRWCSPAPGPAASAGTPKNFTSGRATSAAQFEREGSAAVANIRAWPEPHAVRAQGSARVRAVHRATRRTRSARLGAHVARVPGRASFTLRLRKRDTEIDDANVDRGWR